MEEKRSGFYFEGELMSIKYDSTSSISSLGAFTPYNFNKDSVEFVFLREQQEGVEGFTLNNLSPGCYKITIKFNSCIFFNASHQYRMLKLKRCGKKLIMGNYKYSLVTHSSW